MSFENDKSLGGIGAVLVAVGSVSPIIGIVGMVLVLIALKGLAEYYREADIFRNALYGIIMYIIGVVVASVISLVAIFGGILSRMASATASVIGPESIAVTFLGAFVIAVVIMFVFYLVGVLLLRKSLEMLSAKSGETLFNTAGLLLLVGAILTIILIGVIFLLVAWIIIGVAFFSLKPQPSQSALSSPPPSQPTQPSQ
ncbi:MAG: DUF996 domain-containing protein [Candidatus Bathyarchaeia archaeon]